MTDLLPAKAVVSFGMGGAFLDPTYGERWFVERLRAQGVHCADPYQWNDTQKIVDDLLSTPAHWVLAVFGDSLGACEAPHMAQYVAGRRMIDCIGGFQPSFWGEHIYVPSNVREAICEYDPSFIFTIGLGGYRWKAAPGNTVTKMEYIPKIAFHPDDNDIPVQNVFLDMVRRHRTPKA